MDSRERKSGPGQVLGVWHVGLTVRDMDESLRFFRDGLGLEIAHEYENRERGRELLQLDFESMRVVFLAVPGTEVGLELQEYRGLERHSASARPSDWGSGHFCLYVDDAEAVCARLAELGYSTRGPVHAFGPDSPRAGAKGVYAISPDGHYVELYQPAPGELDRS